VKKTYPLQMKERQFLFGKKQLPQQLDMAHMDARIGNCGTCKYPTTKSRVSVSEVDTVSNLTREQNFMNAF